VSKPETQYRCTHCGVGWSFEAIAWPRDHDFPHPLFCPFCGRGTAKRTEPPAMPLPEPPKGEQ